MKFCGCSDFLILSRNPNQKLCGSSNQILIGIQGISCSRNDLFARIKFIIVDLFSKKKIKFEKRVNSQLHMKKKSVIRLINTGMFTAHAHICVYSQ